MAIINGNKLSGYDTSGNQVGVSLGEIATVLGEPTITDSVTGASGDALGYLCLSVNVNPWAKDKPLARPSLAKIDDTNKRNGGASEGLFWGLKAATNSWGNIHSCNWSYVDKPNGDLNSAPYRQGDFIADGNKIGYDGSAVPTLRGNSSQGVNGECYLNASYPFEVELTWQDEGNTTGVDVLACHVSNADLRNWYLCIAIDGYARAMINFDAGQEIRPIYYNGRKCRAFSSPALDFSGGDQATTRTVSFFLADLDNLKKDLKTQWVYVGNGEAMSDIVGSRYAVTVPYAVGYNVAFVVVPQTYGQWSGGSIAQFSNNITCGFTLVEAPIEYTEYVFVLRVDGYGTASKELALAAGDKFGFGLVQFPDTAFRAGGLTTGTYAMDITLYAKKGNSRVSIITYATNVSWVGTGGSN